MGQFNCWVVRSLEKVVAHTEWNWNAWVTEAVSRESKKTEESKHLRIDILCEVSSPLENCIMWDTPFIKATNYGQEVQPLRMLFTATIRRGQEYRSKRGQWPNKMSLWSLAQPIFRSGIQWVTGWPGQKEGAYNATANLSCEKYLQSFPSGTESHSPGLLYAGEIRMTKYFEDYRTQGLSWHRASFEPLCESGDT